MIMQKVLLTVAGKSLTRKAISVFTPVFICFFLIVGYITDRVLRSQIINNMKEAVSVLVVDEAKDIDVHFKRLEALGSKSAGMVRKWLKRRPDPPDKASFDKKYKQINGALRTNIDAFFDEDISAAFLSNRTQINDEIRQIMAATEEPFDNYAKGVISNVFNMWLITKHQMGRSYEKDWMLTAQPDYDFTKDIFYYTADPAHNPEAHVKWTKPYYDSIWKHWMTSVVAPVYIDDRFLGVVGHDVVLDDVYAKILNRKYFSSGYGFIFDHGKNIIVHPKYLDRLLESAEMGALLSTSDLGNPELSRVLSTIVDNSAPDRRLNLDYFLDKGKVEYLFAYKLDFLDWYFAIVVPEEEILKMLPQYRRNFIRGAIWIGLLLLLIVIVIIWFSVIKPINTLTKTANAIRMGDLDKTVAVKSRDEIGELSQAFNEMTGRLKTQMRELKTAEEKYRSIFENAVEGIFQTTPDGRFISASPSMASILGYDDPDDLIKCISNLGTDLYVDAAQRDELIRKFDVSDTVSDFETMFYKKDGHTLWVSLNTRAARDAGGRLSYLEGFLSDITERKQAEEALFKLNMELDQRVIDRTAELAQAKEAADKARKKAEVANMAKSTFLANMSHELRTPLNAILGYSQIMQRDLSLLSEQYKYLDTINRSGKHLLALINDVLEISKIEAGQTTIESTTFDLRDLLHQLEKMFDSSMDTKGLHFEVIGIDAVPRYVTTDENKLRQVLVNLLGNAVKFTEQGGVTMRVAVEDAAAERMRLKIEVADTGVGIAEDEIDKVFSYFEQTASGRAKKSGTGLGLAFSRDYVRMMGGDITVASKEGKGSTFYFNMNIGKGRASDIKEKIPERSVIGLEPGQNIPRVLVAEDTETSRTLLVEVLKSVGLDVHEAVNGKQAVEMFHKWWPHFIWMDVRMPVMDGLEATRRIKQTGAGKSTPIAALTAHALEEEKEVILAAGCDDFVRKPFRLNEIFDVMGKHLGLKYAYEESGEEAAPAELEVEIRPEQLANLPADLLSRLYDAAVELDRDRILALIEQIQTIDAHMARVLETSVKNFALGPLLDLLEKIDRLENGDSRV
jgi:PAS domain S-box-containing protein